MRLISYYIPILLCLLLAACQPEIPREEAATPLLELLSPEETGVTFSNDLQATEALNIITFEYFYNGAGVGAGDFNNDGLTDLFFSANMTEARLYLNRGDFQFEDVTDRAGIATQGRWSTGVSLVDINSDGRLDIYLCFAGPYGPAQRANQLYINESEGDEVRFVERAAAYGLADTGHTTQAAFFDYDRDGDLDVYLLTNITEELGPNVIRPKKLQGESPNTDRLYRNEGGRFTDVSAAAGILAEGYGLGVAIQDFNQDNWPDIYVSNDYLSNDLLYLNNQDGTFTDRAAAAFRHTSYSAMGNDAADCNNDGRPDIVTLDMLPPDNKRRKLMIGSIKYDRFRSEMLTGYFPQYVRNTLQLHQGITPGGDPYFSEIGQLAGVHSTDWSWSALFADLDQDGLRDLLITNGYPRDITNMDFASYKMNNLLQGRYNRDQQASLLAAINSIDGAYLPNFAYRNKGDLTFEDVSGAWGFTQPSYSTGAALADLDNDGDLDYIVNNTQGPAFIYRNRAEAFTDRHYLKVKLAGRAGNPAGFGATVRLYAEDRQWFQEHNPYRGFQSTVEPILHFGLGAVTTLDSITVRWNDGREQRLTQVATDQLLTLRQADAQVVAPQRLPRTNALFASAGSEMGLDYRHSEAHYSEFKVQPLLPHQHTQLGPDIALGDVNGDGREDFFIGGAFKQSGQFFLQDNKGRFSAQPLTEADKYEEDLGCHLFDADKDGDLDLYIASGGSEFKPGSQYYQDRLYRNDGRGRFSLDPTALPTMRESTACVVSADYDGDGDLDLFVGGRIVPTNYARIPQSFLLENRNGKFEDVTATACPELQRAGRIGDAAWADFDGDGRIDLAVAGEWTPITIFFQQENGFQRRTLPNTTGWWNTLTAADLDGDGDADLVAGNLGHNTPYRTAGPVRLYQNDFDGNGRTDAVLTFNLQGKEVPVHFRDDMLGWFYPLRKKFRDYTTYAEAGWADIFPAAANGQSQLVEADCLESVWIENEGAAFSVHPLPMPAQFGPVNSFLIADFIGDSRPDLLLAGNAFATETHTGRYDALNGLLLEGVAKGFAVVAPQKSGFYAPGDVRCLALLTLANGEQVVLAGRNDDTLLAFRRLKKD